jgi:HK97 family phage major capsid protein
MTAAMPVKTRNGNGRTRSSLEEFRGVAAGLQAPTPETAWWRYALASLFSEPEAELNHEERRALSRATGPAGNFLVPQDFYNQIIAAARPRNVIAALARTIITETGANVPLPTAPAHGAGGWVAENAAGSGSSDETFAQTELGAYTSRTNVVASEELAQDAGVPFDEYLAGEFGERLAQTQEAAFATGSGSGMPQGFVPNVPAVTASAGSSTGFTLADIKAVYMALPAAYRPMASWVMHPDTFGGLATLTDSAGSLVLPSLQLDPPTLLGRPVFVSAAMPAPAASAKSLAFGDFQSGYAVRRVRGIGVTRLVELYSDQGSLSYRASERVDGRVLLGGDPIRVLQHSAT